MCKRTSFVIVAVLVAASVSWATVVPIDGAAAGDPNMRPYNLESVTVGGITLLANELMTGKTDWIGSDPNDPNIPVLYPVPEMEDFDINTMLQWSGRPGNFQIIFDVLWINTNGDANDFILFEVGGNDGDNPTFAAIFEDDSLGAELHIQPGVNLLPGWMQTDYIRNAADANDSVTTDNQPIAGLAFAITDLLDANGVGLTNDAVIKGIKLVNRGGTDPSGFFAVSPAVRPLESLDVNDPNVAEPSEDTPILVTAINGIPVEELILGTTTARIGQQERADNFDISSIPGYTARTNADNPPENLVITMFDVPVSQVFVLEKDGQDACVVTLLDANGEAIGPDIPFEGRTWTKTQTSEWVIGGISITPQEPISGILIYSTGVDVISISAVPATPYVGPIDSMVADANGIILSINGIDTSELVLGTTTFPDPPTNTGDDYLADKADDFELSNGASGDNQPYYDTIFSLPVSTVFLIENNGNDSGYFVGLDIDGNEVGSLAAFTNNEDYLKFDEYRFFLDQQASGIMFVPPHPIYGIRIIKPDDGALGFDALSTSAVPAP